MTNSLDEQWGRPDGALVELLEERRGQRIRSYLANPHDIAEHVAIERRMREGGYRDRPLLEVVQNGADAIREAGEAGRIDVVLTEDALVVANTGRCLDAEGVASLLQSHLSSKRGAQIGRFGLGFKSILGLSDRPALLSRSIGLQFDARRTDQALSAAGLDTTDLAIPILRMAWPVDAPTRLRSSKVLTQLGQWAETLLILPLSDASLQERLAGEFKAFPAEFILFCGVELALSFEDRRTGWRRTLNCLRDGVHAVLDDTGSETTWQVFQRSVTPCGTDVLADAGSLFERPEIPMAWAVPTRDGRTDAGRFWAFFPLAEHARVPGILNAPWKTSDDRSSVLQGAYNDWLIDEFAAMVVDSYPSLHEESDPGAVLEYLPRRTGGDDFADQLSAGIWKRVPELALVADTTGTLRVAAELRLAPVDDVGLQQSWARLAPGGSRLEIVHASVRSSRDRIGRWRRLRYGTWETSADRKTVADSDGADRLSTSAWIEAVATVEQGEAVEVLKFVESVLAFSLTQAASTRVVLDSGVMQSRVIPTSNGLLVAAKRDGERPLYLPGAEQPPADAHTVASAVGSHIEARRILSHVLRVPEFSPAAWEASLVAQICMGNDWDEIWCVLSAAPRGLAERALSTARAARVSVKVRSMEGTWYAPSRLLLPGELVSVSVASEEMNQRFFADSGTDEGLRALLLAAGVREAPKRYPWPEGSSMPSLLQRYHCDAEGAFEAVRREGEFQRPHAGYVAPLGRNSYAWPLDALQGGSLAVRAELTAWALEQPDLCSTTHVGHMTRQEAYPVVVFQGWLSWVIEAYGILKLEGGYIPLREILGVAKQEWLQVLPDLVDRLAPIRELASSTNANSALPLPTSALWAALEASALNYNADSTRLALYRSMAESGFELSTMYLAGVEIQVEKVYVTGSASKAELARQAGHAVLDVSPRGLKHLRSLGSQDLEQHLEVIWSPSSPPVAFSEFFFEIGVEQSWWAKTAPRVAVGSLGLQLGDSRMPMLGGAILVDTEIRVDAEELLTDRPRVLDHTLKLLVASGRLALPDGADLTAGANSRRRNHVASAPTVAERLLRAVGESTNPLLERLVAPLRPVCVGIDEGRIAELFLATHGPDSLRTLTPVLDQQGLAPPGRWTGTGESLAFVRALGFPDEYAGGITGHRTPWEEVRGLVRLKPLHDYQADIVGQLAALFASTDGRRRAILSLPTGAGKTRIAVQALVERVLMRRGSPLVLWVAQQDELCEQAVQCFIQVWANLGPEGQRLRVSRLWGGFGVGLSELDAGPQVVVATIQSLGNRFDTDGFSWLSQPDAVVVDEAHYGTTPTYTGLLKWFASADETDPAPLLGLTATPFRGFDERETDRLSKRFDRRLIPSAEEQPALYKRLQDKGVLARVQQQLLESPVSFDFSEDELNEIARFAFGRFPSSAARRLGRNEERNRLIVERILGLDELDKVLVFACSVEHAQLLAGLLNLRGRKSAAIAGDTGRGLRQSFIDEFLDGDLRVLTNYGVLTTGFDAPQVDTIVLARPTFSPVLYQQMIGRGLRGPLNGGKESCRLINVFDNLARFGDRLAFHHFTGLWDERPKAD